MHGGLRAAIGNALVPIARKKKLKGNLWERFTAILARRKNMKKNIYIYIRISREYRVFQHPRDKRVAYDSDKISRYTDTRKK